MRIRTLDITFSFTLILFGMWVLYEAAVLGVSSIVGPGPGTFPLISGGLILAFSAANFLNKISLKSDDSNEDDKLPTIEVIRIIGIICSVTLYITVFSYTGPFTTLPILMMSISLMVKPEFCRKWITQILSMSVAFTVILYLVFSVFLGVLLPEGPFGF